MVIPEWKKHPCMQKISILALSLSVLEPYFSFPKGAIENAKPSNFNKIYDSKVRN